MQRQSDADLVVALRLNIRFAALKREAEFGELLGQQVCRAISGSIANILGEGTVEESTISTTIQPSTSIIALVWVKVHRSCSLAVAGQRLNTLALGEDLRDAILKAVTPCVDATPGGTHAIEGTSLTVQRLGVYGRRCSITYCTTEPSDQVVECTLKATSLRQAKGSASLGSNALFWSARGS